MGSKLTRGVVVVAAFFALFGVAQGQTRNYGASEHSVHLAFTRLVLNESGWRSTGDANGILRSLINNIRITGEFDVTDADHRSRFMRYTALVGNRTFPADSPWLGLMTDHARDRHSKNQRRFGNAVWTSGFHTSCEKPTHWDEAYPESDWAGYTTRCAELVKTTQALLKMSHQNWCHTAAGPADPKWWGGEMDLHRVQRDWEEVICDAPGATCTEADRSMPNTPPGCTKNRYFRKQVRAL
jgi:hypothetical protein